MMNHQCLRPRKDRAPSAATGSEPTRADWHSGLRHARWRTPIRGSVRNQWRQMEHGLFWGAGIGDSSSPHTLTHPPGFSSSCLDHSWKAEAVNFSRAPKAYPYLEAADIDEALRYAA